MNSKYSATLFIGNERYLKEKALNELRSSIMGESLGDLDYKVFYGGEASTRDILDYAATFPFSSAKRLIVIKDFEKLSKEDSSRLIAYIIKGSRAPAHIAIDAKNDSILREHPSLKKTANVLQFNGLRDSALSSWIKGYVSSRDKSIDDDAVGCLKEPEARELLPLAQEIEKLISFVGERGSIKIGDVENLVGRSLIASAFDLAWAIGNNDATKALELVSDLLASGKRTYELIGALCWHFKRLLRAKVLNVQGETDPRIANILGLNRKSYDEFFKQVRFYDIAEIGSKMSMLLDADLETKKALSSPELLLEIAIIRLCLA